MGVFGVGGRWVRTTALTLDFTSPGHAEVNGDDRGAGWPSEPIQPGENVGEKRGSARRRRRLVEDVFGHAPRERSSQHFTGKCRREADLTPGNL
eukprot:ctg_2148.g337